MRTVEEIYEYNAIMRVRKRTPPEVSPDSPNIPASLSRLLFDATRALPTWLRVIAFVGRAK